MAIRFKYTPQFRAEYRGVLQYIRSNLQNPIAAKNLMNTFTTAKRNPRRLPPRHAAVHDRRRNILLCPGEELSCLLRCKRGYRGIPPLSLRPRRHDRKALRPRLRPVWDGAFFAGIVKICRMCYTSSAAASPAGKEAKHVHDLLLSFIISVLSGVVVYYICKRLAPHVYAGSAALFSSVARLDR